MNWVDFICSGKKPAILIAKRSGSSVTKGNTYRSWGISKGKFLIWNDRDNAVLAAKGFFKVEQKGDVA